MISCNGRLALALAIAAFAILSANGAPCNWVVTVGNNSPGGNAQSANELITCQNLCAAYSTTTCKYGMDWDPTNTQGNRCWFSTSSNLGNSNGVTHYKWTCGPETTGQWAGCYYNISMNTNSLGGVQQPSINNFTSCFMLCDDDDFCKSFDWMISSSQCWTNNNQNNVINYNGASGVVNYNYICPNVSPTAPITMSQAMSSYSSSACSNWLQAQNSNSPGGNNQPSVTSLNQCQSVCMATSNCQYGFDWNSGVQAGQQCWISTSSTINTNTYPGVTHYTCSTSGTSAGPSPSAGPTATAGPTGTGMQWTTGGIKTSRAFSSVLSPGLTLAALLFSTFLW